MLLTYSQIYIQPDIPALWNGLPSIPISMTTGFSIHTSSIHKARKNIIYTSIQFAVCK